MSKFAAAYKLHFAGAILAVLLASTFFLWIPKILGNSVDDALKLVQSGSYSDAHIRSMLLGSAILLVVVSALRGTASFMQQFLGESLAQRVAAQLRVQFFDKLQRLSFSFHDNAHTGNLMSRGLSDIEGVRMFVQMGVMRSFYIVIMTVTCAVFMVLINWELALLSMSFVPLVVFQSSRLRIRLRRYWKMIQESLGEMGTMMQENLAGIRVVRAFSAQAYEFHRFDEEAKNNRSLLLKAITLQAGNGGMMSFAFLIAWVIILWVGGLDVIHGSMTPGQLTEFFLYMSLLQMPVRQIPFLLNSISRGHSCGYRVLEVLDEPEVVTDAPQAQALAARRGVVQFHDVSFTYDGASDALEHISFEASPEHTIGIVGPPGSGKSTIASLLARFYDVSSGRITIDGQDLREVTLGSLRDTVGIVQQDPFLFDGTIRDNVRYGNLDASQEDVEEATRIAQIHDFIAGLPAGYDTEIGERGVGLSGGQRQRVAIARTLVLKPPVIVFDDSTSSVDAGTDRRIRTALREAKGKQTVIIIAHRLSSLERANEILVLDRGRIVERGTHDELMALKGRYFELWALQERPQDEGDQAQPGRSANGHSAQLREARA